MGLETGSYLDDLDPTWPLQGDPVNQGSAHIRLIKDILQTTFPGAAAGGFAKAIIATEDEINYLSGVTSNVQDQLNALDVRVTANEAAIVSLGDNLSAPATTAMSFYQAAAPTGWTQIITADVNNAMLRVVNTAGGGNGGSDNPILMTGTDVPAHPHAFTTDAGGVHNHPMYRGTEDGGGGTLWAAIISQGLNGKAADVLDNSVSHTHTGTTDNNSGDDWTPKYVDMIICTKD